MKLYIKVVDGKTVNHPCLESNLLEVYSGVIPSEYESFERKPNELKPTLFQRSEASYIKDEATGVWQDHWVIVDKTELEIEETKKSLTARIELRIANFKILAKQGLVACLANNDVNGVNAFSSFLERLEAYQLVSVFPVAPPIPSVPLRGDDGYWYCEVNSDPLFNVPVHMPVEQLPLETSLAFNYDQATILP